jgi:hypothetical protein
VKSIKWDEVDIDDLPTEELKKQLGEIIKATGVTRTLGEVLADYKLNHRKLELGQHPDRPHKPVNPASLYLEENREKITQKFEKQRPGEKYAYVSL